MNECSLDDQMTLKMCWCDKICCRHMYVHVLMWTHTCQHMVIHVTTSFIILTNPQYCLMRDTTFIYFLSLRSNNIKVLEIDEILFHGVLI